MGGVVLEFILSTESFWAYLWGKRGFSLISLFLLIQETQTELVMFILLRLAEDVVTFQTLPPQRRRDIQQTLTQNMEKIFSFLLNTLQENVNKYRQAVRATPPPKSGFVVCFLKLT